MTLIPITYLLDRLDKYRIITIEAVNYDDDGKPNKWAVRGMSGRMNKRTGLFEYEPMNSSKTDAYKRTHSFDSVEEATEAFEKTRAKRQKAGQL